MNHSSNTVVKVTLHAVDCILKHVHVLCRDQETQTKTDASTNVPRPQVFLAGLRGGGMSTATQMVKVDLTQDVDQT